MDTYTIFPDAPIPGNGLVGNRFLGLGIDTFLDACRYVHRLPYGYNSDRDDLMGLFKDGMGSCTTKHGVIGTLAAELELPIEKNIGIYAMTEAIVTGTAEILETFYLPYLPMIHCFLVYRDFRVDLTEENRNGKNRPIDDFLYTERVAPNISEKDEYRRYRKALTDRILLREELKGVDVKRVLKAREKGIALLREKVAR
jgi:hypothetical protein